MKKKELKEDTFENSRPFTDLPKENNSLSNSAIKGLPSDGPDDTLRSPTPSSHIGKDILDHKITDGMIGTGFMSDRMDAMNRNDGITKAMAGMAPARGIMDAMNRNDAITKAMVGMAPARGIMDAMNRNDAITKAMAGMAPARGIMDAMNRNDAITKVIAGMAPARGIMDAMNRNDAITKSMAGMAPARDIMDVMTKKHNALARGVAPMRTIMNSIQSMYGNLDKLTSFSDSITHKWGIPKSGLDSIINYQNQNRALKEKLNVWGQLGLERGLDSARMNIATSQISSFYRAIEFAGQEIVKDYTRSKDWAALEQFSDLSSRITALETSAIRETALTKKELESHTTEIINFITQQFDILKRAKSNKVDRYLAIAGLALAIISMFFDTPKLKIFSQTPLITTNVGATSKVYATKEDVEQAMNNVLKRLDSKFEMQNAVVMRECKIRLKPKSKSTVTCTLQKGTQIAIIQKSHEWCLVKFTDENDSLLATGWVLKKYLEIAN